MSRLLPISFVCALLVSAALPAQASSSCTIKFKETTLSAGTNPQTIVTGDFNRDGKLDFALVDYNGGSAGSVSVYLGNGDGTFQPKVDYPAGAGPDALAVGDVNGDGIPDLVVGNDLGASVSVFLGNGDGTFQAKQDYSAGLYPHGVVLADFNGDHAPDIAVTNEGSNNVGVFLNNGDGTFAAMKTFGVASEPYSLAPADFNGDGKTDLAVTGYYNSVISILIGKGDGAFKTYTDVPTGTAPAVVLAHDFNGDGNIDLAAIDYNNGNTGSVSILLGKGDGTFGTHTDYATGTGPAGMTIGRFNDDKFVDLAVTNLIGNSMSILPGNGDGTFGAPQSFTTPKYPLGVAAGRFHGQRKTKEDVVVSNDLANDATFFLNKGCR